MNICDCLSCYPPKSNPAENEEELIEKESIIALEAMRQELRALHEKRWEERVSLLPSGVHQIPTQTGYSYDYALIGPCKVIINSEIFDPKTVPNFVKVSRLAKTSFSLAVETGSYFIYKIPTHFNGFEVHINR